MLLMAINHIGLVKFQKFHEERLGKAKKKLYLLTYLLLDPEDDEEKPSYPSCLYYGY